MAWSWPAELDEDGVQDGLELSRSYELEIGGWRSMLWLTLWLTFAFAGGSRLKFDFILIFLLVMLF